MNTDCEVHVASYFSKVANQSQLAWTSSILAAWRVLEVMHLYIWQLALLAQSSVTAVGAWKGLYQHLKENVMCCMAFLVFFVLHSQQTKRLPQSSSFTQHAKQVSLSVMSPFCVGECAFSTCLRACLRVHAVRGDCLTLCWTWRVSHSCRLHRHALTEFLSVQREKERKKL